MTQAELIGEAERYKGKAASFRAAHFSAGDHLRIAHYVLGFLLILFSAVVSGSVLQATDGDPSGTLTLTAGALSIAVVVLTAVQTTFKLGQRGDSTEAQRSASVNSKGSSTSLSIAPIRTCPRRGTTCSRSPTRSRTSKLGLLAT